MTTNQKTIKSAHYELIRFILDPFVCVNNISIDETTLDEYASRVVTLDACRAAFDEHIAKLTDVQSWAKKNEPTTDDAVDSVKRQEEFVHSAQTDQFAFIDDALPVPTGANLSFPSFFSYATEDPFAPIDRMKSGQLSLEKEDETNDTYSSEGYSDDDEEDEDVHINARFVTVDGTEYLPVYNSRYAYCNNWTIKYIDGVKYLHNTNNNFVFAAEQRPNIFIGSLIDGKLVKIKPDVEQKICDSVA
jgi:hypothetical protein